MSDRRRKNAGEPTFLQSLTIHPWCALGADRDENVTRRTLMDVLVVFRRFSPDPDHLMKNISPSDSRLEEHYEPSGKVIRLFAVIVDVSGIKFLN
ncbi:hypothetical protein [Sinorhizobium sp. CCBAU 05631]|uniref:hypothetical protein n=2 Tax=Sinorhizobium sp. CCBAU 05631 TaxID=794846 RepID=UPI001AEC94A4